MRSKQLRPWVFGRLGNINDAMGIRRANVLAQALNTGQETNLLGFRDKRAWQELAAEYSYNAIETFVISDTLDWCSIDIKDIN